MLGKVRTISIPRQLSLFECGPQLIREVLPQFLSQGVSFSQFHRRVHDRCVAAHRCGRSSQPFIAAVADQSGLHKRKGTPNYAHAQRR